MDKLGSLIPNSLKKGGADRTVRAAMIASAVEAAVGEVILHAAGKVKAVSAKNGTVRLRCDSSAIAEDVRLHERDIVESAARTVGEDAVRRIVATS